MDGGEEGAVVLDQDGRPRGVTGGVEYGFQSFPGALKGDLDRLRRDCEEAFTARAVENGDEYSTGETFFILADGESPRCELERLAMLVFDAHVKNAEGLVDRSKSGAEWWTQVIDEGDDIGFHFDRDYALEQEAGINIHPHVATVTYLADIGGPTIVFDVIAPSTDDDASFGDQSVHQGFLSFPVIGKHISFDGRFLHGAYSDLGDIRPKRQPPSDSAISDSEVGGKRGATTMTKRISFLVNVWVNYEPLHADRFPEDKLASQTVPMGSSRLNIPVPAPKLTEIHANRNDDRHSFAFDGTLRRVEVGFHCSPSSLVGHASDTDQVDGTERSSQASEDAKSSSFLLKFDDDSCRLKLREPLSPSSEGEDDGDDDLEEEDENNRVEGYGEDDEEAKDDDDEVDEENGEAATG